MQLFPNFSAQTGLKVIEKFNINRITQHFSVNVKECIKLIVVIILFSMKYLLPYLPTHYTPATDVVDTSLLSLSPCKQ